MLPFLLAPETHLKHILDPNPDPSVSRSPQIPRRDHALAVRQLRERFERAGLPFAGAVPEDGLLASVRWGGRCRRVCVRCVRSSPAHTLLLSGAKGRVTRRASGGGDGEAGVPVSMYAQASRVSFRLADGLLAPVRWGTRGWRGFKEVRYAKSLSDK